MDEESIFAEAIEKRTYSERAAFVAQACGNNLDLQDSVQSLLDAYDEGQFLEAPAHCIGNTSDLVAAETPGTLIGRYKLLELIGEGGFGAVYMAEQEEPVRRKVALKIIKLGMDTKQVIARFEAERQALAMMDHPNIAKVLDAGATETGRPYFVMELVRGISIIEYCDQHKLTTTDRLRLFAEVCHAVQHAHQKGIIHRDIKPTNVMVTSHGGKPVPKVIDFGIAKATQQRLTEKTLYTSYHQLIGTPQYMSPEQAAMCEEDVDTRSDIYSLGVVLYELLVGTTPFDPDDLRTASYDQICRTIRESEPATPSKKFSTLGDAITTISAQRQVQPTGLRHQLRGDLDWIVMKALEKDRTRRYETADALARDVDRYLDDEPVSAGQPSTAYRLRKFVRKHRVPVSTGMAIFATLALGMIAATIGFVRANQQRQIAVLEKNRADQKATEVIRTARKLAQQLYVSDVNSAYEAWDAGNIDRGSKLLRRHIPKSGDVDLRGFEWHYLWGRYQHTLRIPALQHHSITSIAFSPKGSVLATAAWDGTVRLWDIATQTPIQTLEHEDTPLAIAFSPDGRFIASGGRNRAVKLWEAATQELLGTLTHDEYVASLAFSPDGKILAAGGGHYRIGEIKLWNVAEQFELASLSKHTARVNSLAFSPDGSTLASGSADRSIKLWDIKKRQEVATLLGHTDRVRAVAISRDGAVMASGSRDRSVKIWDMTTHKLRATSREGLGSVWCLAFAPDARTIAIGSTDSRVRIWHWSTGRLEYQLSGHTAAIKCLAFSPDGTLLATGSKDHTVKLMKTVDLPPLRSRQEHTDRLSRIALHESDGKILAAVSGELATQSNRGAVVLWKLAAGQHPRATKLSDAPAFCVALSPDGRVMATGDSRSPYHIKLWDVASGKLRTTLAGHKTSVWSLAFSPNGETLASGDWGDPNGQTNNLKNWAADTKLWDVTSGQLLETVRNERFAAVSMAYSPDGMQLAIGGGQWGNGVIKLWNLHEEHEPVVFDAPTALVFCVAFTQDGRLLACSDHSGTVYAWDLAGDKQLFSVRAHPHTAPSVAFSPDSRTLASVGNTNVRLWHVPTGEALATLKARVLVSAVSFFPDGKTLSVGCTDNSVALWDIQSGEMVLRHE